MFLLLAAFAVGKSLADTGRAAVGASKGARPEPAAPGLHHGIPRPYLDAIVAFKGGRYAAAYGRFSRLADAGHVPSAQAALFMLRNGEALFGSAWSASEDQIMHWNALVINSARSGIDVVSFQGGD